MWEGGREGGHDNFPKCPSAQGTAESSCHGRVHGEAAFELSSEGWVLWEDEGMWGAQREQSAEIGKPSREHGVIPNKAK